MTRPIRSTIIFGAAALFSLGFCRWTAAEDGNTPPETQPTTEPTTQTRQPLTRELKRSRLLNYVRGEYGKMLRNRDWVTRSFALLGLARIPGAEANDPLLGALLNDKNDVVRMIAFEALLARGPTMSEEEVKQWLRGTYSLAESGAFKGNLRLALVKVLATQPPEKKTRAIFMRLFDETNTGIGADTPVIKAMGELLVLWKSPELVEQLIEKMSNINDCYRAEAVLRAGGASGPVGAGIKPSSTYRAQGSEAMWQITKKAYAVWWKEIKPMWEKETGGSLAPLKGLAAQHIAAPIPLDQIDPDDVRWHRELELGWPKIRSFDLAFAIDATGSMQPLLNWLRTDMKRMLKALALVCGEPRIGITFYRDHGDEFVTQVVPLTDKLDVLLGALTLVPAKGGGDIPEAVLDGLTDCMKASRWNQNSGTPKVIVLVGDAPPHPKTEDDCVKLAAAATEKGFKFYALKAKTQYSHSVLEIFDKIAAAGNGASFSAAAADQPGTKLLTGVLLGMVNPEYRERVEPWVHIILEMLTEPVAEAHTPFPPPVPYTGPARPPSPRKDPQAR